MSKLEAMQIQRDRLLAAANAVLVVRPEDGMSNLLKEIYDLAVIVARVEREKEVQS